MGEFDIFNFPLQGIHTFYCAKVNPLERNLARLS